MSAHSKSDSAAVRSGENRDVCLWGFPFHVNPECSVGWLTVTSEEYVRALSLRVAAAPENSEELRTAMDELRAALKASVGRGRDKIAAMRKTIPPPKDHS